jgi:hypothetical protein
MLKNKWIAKSRLNEKRKQNNDNHKMRQWDGHKERKK